MLTYLKNNLKPTHLTDIQDKAVNDGLEATVTLIHIKQSGKPVVVLGIYRPPSASVSWFIALNDLILEAGSKRNLLILGDLNSDLLKPDRYPGKALLDSLELAGTLVASGNYTPTRVTSTSATCLDIIAVDRNIACSHYEVLNIASSDHFPVIATIRTFGNADLVPIVKRSFAKVDYNILAERCQSIVLDINSSTTVDSIVEQWYER